jgi:Zinc finger, C4 type (two domains)
MMPVYFVNVQGLTSPLFDSSVMSECSFSDDSSQADASADQSYGATSSGGGKMKRSSLTSKHGKGDKLCAVCGDKALGCNFDAISCESCKAFFRRNAFKEMASYLHFVRFVAFESFSCMKNVSYVYATLFWT